MDRAPPFKARPIFVSPSSVSLRAPNIREGGRWEISNVPRSRECEIQSGAAMITAEVDSPVLGGTAWFS